MDTRQLNEIEWQKILAQLDESLLGTMERYLKLRRLGGADLVRGYTCLVDPLSSGDEPNYKDPAVVAAYGFKYFARRVVAAFGALTLLDTQFRPSRVLDIASGSDATAIALSLRYPGRRIHIDAIEPSDEMRALGAQLAWSSAVVVRHVQAAFGDIAGGGLPPGSYDLITMSAGLPYTTTWALKPWSELVGRIADSAAVDSSIIAIEPGAKADILVGLDAELRDTGRFRTQQWCCHDMPSAVRAPHEMRRMSLMQQRYHPDASPVQSWNPLRRELVIVGRTGALAAAA